jgi:Ca2+-binding EF-hand superfamily protein
MLLQVHGLFATFDKDGSGVVDEEEFRVSDMRIRSDRHGTDLQGR